MRHISTMFPDWCSSAPLPRSAGTSPGYGAVRMNRQQLLCICVCKTTMASLGCDDCLFIPLFLSKTLQRETDGLEGLPVGEKQEEHHNSVISFLFNKNVVCNSSLKSIKLVRNLIIFLYPCNFLSWVTLCYGSWPSSCHVPGGLPRPHPFYLGGPIEWPNDRSVTQHHGAHHVRAGEGTCGSSY